MIWNLIPLLLPLVFFLRVYAVLRVKQPLKRSASEKCSVAVFLGSGGHTSEALTLVSALDFKRYHKRTYIVSEGDFLSARKALDFEAKRHEDPSRCRILTIPRARNVHQSLVSTPLSTLYSLVYCVYHLTLLPLLTREWCSFADILILNGPGTCFVLCVVVFINKFLGLPSPKVIYVETFARVKSLSLSGKLICPLADRFLTQWEGSEQQTPNSLNWMV